MDRSAAAYTRRRFLRGLGIAAAALAVPSAVAGELVRTPQQTAGPFYPDALPLDRDNDLVVSGDSDMQARGEITHLTGRILDVGGAPVRDALVEIWQVDANGVYLHTGSWNRDARDRAFQGYGRFTTGANGDYRFRTIKPVPYPGRTPHIHVAVTVPGRQRFTTQCYVEGEPMNTQDYLYNSILDPAARAAVTVAFAPSAGVAAGNRRAATTQAELTARFDVVLGFTPAA